MPAVAVSAATSTGNITTAGGCQISNGASTVADVNLGTALADVARSTARTRACRDEAPVQTNTSAVIELGGVGVGIPAAGCANGTPDTEFGLLAPLLPIVCNADDSSQTTPNGTQADRGTAALPAAYGVRNALDVYVLALLGPTSVAQVSTAQSESRAVAPAAPATTTTPTTTTPVTTTTPTTTTTPRHRPTDGARHSDAGHR